MQFFRRLFGGKPKPAAPPPRAQNVGRPLSASPPRQPAIDLGANLARWKASGGPMRIVAEVCGYLSDGDLHEVQKRAEQEGGGRFETASFKKLLSEAATEWSQDPINKSLQEIVAPTRSDPTFKEAVKRLAEFPNGTGIDRLVETFKRHPGRDYEWYVNGTMRSNLGVALVLVGRRDVLYSELERTDVKPLPRQDIAWMLHYANDPDSVRFAVDYALDYSRNHQHLKRGDDVIGLLKTCLSQGIDKVDESVLRDVLSLPKTLIAERKALIDPAPHDEQFSLSEVQETAKAELIRRGAAGARPPAPPPPPPKLPTREYAVAFTFPYGGPEAAKNFFAVLHKSSSTFPYKAPHQVAHVRGGAGDFVAVLVQLENKNDESVEVMKRLERWFTESGAGSHEDDEWLTAPLPDRKKGSLPAVLGSAYSFLQKFGNI